MTYNTSFKKNLVRSGFKGLKPSVVVGLWIVLLIIGLFLFVDEVLGADPIFEDDFESYTTGEDLGAQEDWICNYSSNNQPTISEDRAESGIKSVRNKYVNNPAESQCIRDDTPSEEGSQQVWFYITSEFTGYVSFYIDYEEVALRIEDDLVKYTDTSYQWQTLTTFDKYDEWVQLSIAWKNSVSPSSEISYSYNGGDWTDWEIYANTSNYGRVAITWSTQQATATLYWDTIEEAPPPCEIGTCFACGWYGACEEAGCFWYYSIYQPGGLWSGATGGWCIEPYEPEAEECGALFKCQYCMSQETCEAENCEWEDRYGTGEKCYTPEPTIPPEQVEWQVPDLEECGELSGVEKWLCEIKNFGAGIFMPSQAKVSELYYTIGAFKDRFPFSYVETLNRFFTEIEASLDEEKAIPITILGEESEVSFAFWDTETTIGGEVETFKNIWFDFTSLIIIFAWFMWLISVIRRFF